MLRVTYIGWQGWLVESERGRLLIDPLLVDEIGRGLRQHRLTYCFWPPRRFEPAAFPAVDAVLISHEHEDHFSIPTLARLDRAIPIFLSARASIAARTLLDEMGFRITLIYPDDTVSIGDLELSVFTPDHVAADQADEWDTLAYLVRERHGDGNFFSNVDVTITAAMAEAVAAAALAPGGHAVETLVFKSKALGVWTPAAAEPIAIRDLHRSPAGIGFAWGDDALAALRAGRPLLPLPGQSITLVGGRPAATSTQAAWLAAPPREEWPAEPRYWPTPGADIEPFCGRRELADAELSELEAGLDRLAGHLYGTRLFKRLHSLGGRALGGLTPTFVWVLRCDADGGALAYEYRPERCAFVAVTIGEQDLAGYAGVLTAWATDLVGVFRGEYESRCLTKSYREMWQPPLQGASFLMEVFWLFFHPLRDPGGALRQYRRTLAAEVDAPRLVSRAEQEHV